MRPEKVFCVDLYNGSVCEDFPSCVTDLEVVAQALVDQQPHALHLQREDLCTDNHTAAAQPPAMQNKQVYLSR